MVVSVPFFMGCVVDVPDSLLTPINVVGFGLVSLSLTVPQHRHHEELQNPSSTDSYNEPALHVHAKRIRFLKKKLIILCWYLST